MTTPTQTRARGPRASIAIVLMVLGVLLGAGGVIALVAGVWDTFTGPTYSLPGEHRMHLGEGRHLIFERTVFIGGGSVTLTPGDVNITDPSGSSVAVQRHSTNQTITRNDDEFVSVLQFDAPRDGTYRLSGDGTPAEVMVQRPLQDLVLRNAGWILAIVVGGLLLVLGFVLLIVGIVRRSNDRRAATAVATPFPGTGTPTAFPPAQTAAPFPPAQPTTPAATTPPPASALPPAAWHPDPTGQHRLRYWDGNAWTDYTSD